MTKEEAYQVLGLNESATLDDIKKARRRLLKLYHEDEKTADREKYDEVGKAYKTLMNEENKEPVDTRPPRNKDKAYRDAQKAKEAEQKKEDKQKKKDKLGELFNQGKKKVGLIPKEEKVFDELIELRNNIEEELKKQNIKIKIKYNEELYNSSKRGTIDVSLLQDEQTKIKDSFTRIINSANEYDKLQSIVVTFEKQLLKWGIENAPTFLDKSKIDIEYRGYTKASEFERIRHIVENKMIEMQENVEEWEIFLDFIDKEINKINGLAPDINIGSVIEDIKASKGMISAKELLEQRILLNEMIKEKEKIVAEFKMFFEQVEQRVKSLYGASLNGYNDYYVGDSAYQYSEEQLNEVRKKIKEYEKSLEENSKACNEFTAYYENLSKSDKEIFQEIMKIDEILKDENKAKFSKRDFEELKRKFHNLKEEKIKKQEYLELATAYYDFFDVKAEELRRKYNVNMDLWKSYRNKNYSLETLEMAKKDLLEEEKEIREKATAYDEFMEFYQTFDETEQALFSTMIKINDYIAQDKRLSYTRENYDKLREEMIALKNEKDFKDKQERDLKAKAEFITFFKAKEERLKKQFGINLDKWQIFKDEENSFDADEYLRAKAEILALEQELEEKKADYLKSVVYNQDQGIFEKVVATAAEETIQSLNKAQKEKDALLKAYNEFILFFDSIEKRLKKLYGADLNKWQQFRNSNNHTLKELRQVQNEISVYEKDIRERTRAFDEFLAYYEKLSEKDKELCRSNFNIECYITSQNRLLYSKKTYDDLKEQILKYKQEKELQEKQEHYNEIKQKFIAFFIEKERLFKKLYNTDLYRWRPYGDISKDFTEDDYLNVKKEIRDFEEEKEKERKKYLQYLKNTLNILGVDIKNYLDNKNQDIATISINDITTHSETLFNIVLIVSKIQKLSRGKKALNAYLQNNNKTILEVPYSELEELYKQVCVEVTREEQENYYKFIKFYQSKKYIFENLYGENLSKWSNYVKENAEDNSGKKDYIEAIKEIEELEKELEEKRMNLAYALQLSLKTLGLDCDSYLKARGKTLLSVSIQELEKYKNFVDKINKICAVEESKKLLIEYLEANNIKLITLNDNGDLSAIYAMLEEDMTSQLDDYNEYNYPRKV